MDNEEGGKLLDYVELGRYKMYQFYDHGEFQVKLVQSDSQPERYVIIDKQALAALAAVVRRLADKLTV